MKITVTGMTCQHCEMAVRKALTSVKGVSNVVSVDRLNAEAIVEGNPDVADLIKAVESAGYHARAAN